MRVNVARLMVGAVAWAAIAAAAVFVFRTEKQIAASLVMLRAFDVQARELADRVAELRPAEQAYVAQGQGGAFWMLKVDSTLDAIAKGVTTLRELAKSEDGRKTLDEAASTVAEFRAIDKRSRDYLKAGQLLMAGDVIFTEGGQTAATLAQHVETARNAETEAHDRSEAALRRLEMAALGGAAGIATLIVLVLIPRAKPREAAHVTDATDATAPVAEDAAPASATALLQRPPAAQPVSGVLRTASELCTDLGRVRDANDLEILLARACEAIDASGIVVWLGNAQGADLRPILAHGYSAQAVARMPSVPRTADNAAAAAYRSGELRIVMSRPGDANGAIVAPIFSSDGCIGALSAEVRGGGEASESVQAITTLIAAQLSTIVASSASPDSAAEPASDRAAASS